jgi:hypothetical protein
VWLGDKSAYPIIAVIGGAVALCAGTSTHYLTHSPDVQWAKGERGSTVRMNFAEGSRWSSHKPGLSLPRDEVSKIGIMPGLNNTFGK